MLSTVEEQVDQVKDESFEPAGGPPLRQEQL